MNEVKNTKLNRIKQRNWRIDLLRIIAMMYVVVLHFLKYGGILQELEQVDCAYLVFWGIEGVAYKAVCIFVLISGYYLIKSYFKPSRFIRFYTQVGFYSIALYTVSLVIGKANLGGISILKAITPITSATWWYVTEYMLLLLCFPIINLVVHSVSKEKLKCIIGVLIFVYSIWQTICFWNYGVFDNGYGIEWFIVLYVIGAYIRLYGISIKKSVLISILFICDFLMIVSRIGGHMITQRFAAYDFFEELCYTYTSPLVLVSAVSIFLLFEKSKRCVPTPISKCISALSEVSFGVYLLSEYPLLRGVIWETFRPARYLPNILYTVWYMICVVLSIVVVGCIVEWVRVRLYYVLGGKKLERNIDELWKRYWRGKE